MPPVSWDELLLVAGDSLVGDTGVAVRSPIVRDGAGRVFALRSVDDAAVTPNVLIAEEELRRRLADGAWVAAPAISARRGHVLLLRSADFAGACEIIEHPDHLPWTPAGDRMDMAYVPRDVATAWIESSAAAFLAWARKRLRKHFVGAPDSSSLGRLDRVLQQAIYVCPPRTPTRRTLDTLFGVLLGEMNPSRWPAVARVVLLQTPGLDAATLEADVARLRAELSPPDWAVPESGIRDKLPATPCFFPEAA